MNFISLTRFFSAFILITLLGLQGCYEQSSPGTNDAITDSDDNSETPRQQAGNSSRDSVEISLHPMSQSVHTAQSFTLNVSASGNKVLRYQWRKNGKVIRDAVRPNYTVQRASAADAGSYEVIVMSGRRLVMSRIARITVGSDRSASLSWAPPAKRADGSPLAEEEIAAYRIYHSNDDGSIGRDYEVDPSQQRFELTDLPRGAHHFAIATVDINGMESTLSAVVTKRIL
ncbi:immunoglobulin domain-containing protein [Allohahella marinimesophila]|uniref:Ig-like domain-containing protein n=1 Tax=Allohahella marinimesophila TaxID=1054972 RepID=A0ABP7Q0T8_9GAMM